MRKQMMMLGAAALLVSTAAFGAEIEGRIEETFKVSKGSRLVLTNGNGGVNVDSSDRPEIRVVAEKRVNSRDGERAREATPAETFRLTNGKSARNIPFELSTNLILLRVKVNGERLLTFNLDSGLQTTVLDSTQAAALRLPLRNRTEVKVPGGSLELAEADGVSLALPGLEMRNQSLQTIPLAALVPVFGRPLEGTLGHNLFDRFVVEIDYARRLIHVFEPEGYRYSGRGEIVPVEIVNDEPFIHATIVQPGRAPIAAKLKVDTGSADALGLNGSFVKAEALVSTEQKPVPQPGVALGGLTENYVTRLGALQIGSIIIRDPIAGYSKDLERGGDAGTIGGEIFRRFKVIFDYSRGRIILEKNAAFGEPFHYDASGLFLAAKGSHFEDPTVLVVAGDSPAAAAGIQVGDIIRAIDGRSSMTMTLERLRRMLMDDGRTRTLTIERSGKVIRMKLRLRSLLRQSRA